MIMSTIATLTIMIRTSIVTTIELTSIMTITTCGKFGSSFKATGSTLFSSKARTATP